MFYDILRSNVFASGFQGDGGGGTGAGGVLDGELGCPHGTSVVTQMELASSSSLNAFNKRERDEKQLV